MMDARAILQTIWQAGGLPAESLNQIILTGSEPALPSAFAVGTAAQTTVAAAALAAAGLGQLRQPGLPHQTISVDMQHAAIECSGWFSINGKVPDVWEKFSGLYPCRDGWVRIHANFTHHRDGALALLGLSADHAEKADVVRALQQWRAHDFEQAAAERALVVAAMRSFEEWDRHPQGQAIAAQPLFTIERIGDAAPLPLPPLDAAQRPLSGVRVLDLTRIIAGPVGGRTLAAYGADVMLVNSPNLPNIDSIIESSRGKLSVQLDLLQAQQRASLDQLVAGSHVFVQGYRPGGLAQLGYSPAQLAAKRPGIVAISLSAYGTQGPWAGRRGFDSLVQTASGFNHAEGQAFAGQASAAGSADPKAMPVQILDFATGFLIAYAAACALQRQQQEGGSWHVQLSLAQTGNWLRSLGRVANGFACTMPERAPFIETLESGYGQLQALRHSASFSRTPASCARPSMPPGSHPPHWPD
ncbi:MAG: hypothetical protein RL748_3040 [Pseudomonadota bacterium]